MSGGGGFMSFMNSVIGKNRKLLKGRRKFNERKQRLMVQPLENDRYETREITQEEKALKSGLRKVEKEKNRILYILSTILLLSITLNIYYTFFEAEPKENMTLTRKHLLSSYQQNTKVASLFRKNKQWEAAAANYRAALRYFPEDFNGHQRLLITLTELCKEKNFESCVDAEKHIDFIKPIFPKKKIDFTKLEDTVMKYKFLLLD